MPATRTRQATATDFTFGIEIECQIPCSMLSSRQLGLWNSSGRPIDWLPEGWGVKGDGSIGRRAGHTSVEIVSPILRGVDGLKQCVTVAEYLNSISTQVDRSCGFHVHIGFPRNAEKELAKLIHLVANFEKALYASTGTHSRERGHYARSTAACQSVEAANGRGRFQVLNTTNVRGGRRPTVEFRVFAGTTNAQKIIAHIRTAMGLVERALQTTRKTSWSAKPTSPTSPIARSGEGQTALTRMFYQLGWTKGRVKAVHGILDDSGLPTLKETKRTLMRLAKKYDAA